jgi:nicotinate-nucleotide pyrophosphorylase (carboxylating)
VSTVDPPIQSVREVVRRALAEDLGVLGDVSAALVPEGAVARGTITARAPGVVAGRLCAIEAFGAVDVGIRVDWCLADGSPVDPGSVIAVIEGRLRSVLTAERTALNLVGRLSGIATLTRRYVEAAGAAVTILDTRKTSPGLRALEKAAVRAGGGANHRGSLSDGVLIKDNHLTGLTITEAVVEARRRWPRLWVEVECDAEEQVGEAVGAGADAVLLDNMTPEKVKACVRLVGGRCRTEVSGGVSLETVAAYASTGVDDISVGALTHSAPTLDVGLDLAAGPAASPGGQVGGTS